ELPFRVYAHDHALFNSGDACSAAALRAYRERKEQRRFVDVSLNVETLPFELSKRYLFLEPVLRLVVGYADGQSESKVIELFRRVGEVMFRGFETQPVVEVWELLDPAHPLTRELERVDFARTA
ncbi:MAG: hypothetical protein AAF658_16455, partial [Myxococcota bacterium]